MIAIFDREAYRRRSHPQRPTDWHALLRGRMGRSGKPKTLAGLGRTIPSLIETVMTAVKLWYARKAKS